MKLIHINTENCPTCNSIPFSDRRLMDEDINPLTETREFLCGLVLKYDIISKKVNIIKKCHLSDNYLEIQKKRLDAIKRLVNFCESLDVDETFKKDILVLLAGKLKTTRMDVRRKL